MWVHCEVVLSWDLGDREVAHFCLWFPSIAPNVATIHAKMEIVIDAAGEVSGRLHLRQRRHLEHLPDDEIADV